MSKQIIKFDHDFHKEVDKSVNPREILEISEFFCDTIQGENNVGFPAAFLRLQHCTLNCIWCDTKEVWRFGNPYSFEEIFELMEKVHLHEKLKQGQRLIITGGSPLKQQLKLIWFLDDFKRRYEFSPYVEIENECTLQVTEALRHKVHCWNNSPKLSNSGNTRVSRYKPHIISRLSSFNNSWFKFVVSCEEDWEEIAMDFLDPGLIKRNQIVIMPEGATRKEVIKNRTIAVEMAIKHNVRYTSREHVILWDKRTGV